MQAIVDLYSSSYMEINRFLKHFYAGIERLQMDTDVPINCKHWKIRYGNPVELVDIISAYIENVEDYNISMWVSIDSNVFIKVTPDNSDELIRYLYERFPY